MDNLSPFTQDITGCLVKLGVDCTLRTFSEVFANDVSDYGRVILSGRRKNAREINVANSKILRQCNQMHKPVLGICYGAEIIALTMGGSIRKMPSRIQGPTKVHVYEENPLIGEKKTISVYESHAYCVAKLPPNLRSIGGSENCQHELFSHVTEKIFGTQFHPEKSGDDGLAILRNFSTL